MMTPPVLKILKYLLEVINDAQCRGVEISHEMADTMISYIQEQVTGIVSMHEGRANMDPILLEFVQRTSQKFMESNVKESDLDRLYEMFDLMMGAYAKEPDAPLQPMDLTTPVALPRMGEVIEMPKPEPLPAPANDGPALVESEPVDVSGTVNAEITTEVKDETL